MNENNLSSSRIPSFKVFEMDENLDNMISLYLNVLRHVSSKYEFVDEEISPQQIRVLEYIYEVPNCSMTQICDYFNLAPSAATRFINRLVKNNFLKRAHSDQDRRKVIISMTNNGTQKIIKRRELRVNSLKKLFSKLTKEDIIIQTEILKKLVF